MEKDLPFSVRGTYGFNTPCIEIRDGDTFILCDAGSGLRDFGQQFMHRNGNKVPHDFHILISHLHWDHIHGFPFFLPALAPDNIITLYGCHKDLDNAFTVQQGHPFFPLALKDMAADIRFVKLDSKDARQIQGFKVIPKLQHHPGQSYGYRFEKNGKTIVYSGDLELHPDNVDDVETVISFINKADLLIFDAQYTFVEACTVKKNWGHSSNMVGVELAIKAGVKHLCLFHHDPTSTDEDLDNLLTETIKLIESIKPDYPLDVSIAWDGMIIQI
jgi:phosphoribosyl 1,2-cyclic phosphodiesterase